MWASHSPLLTAGSPFKRGTTARKGSACSWSGHFCIPSPFLSPSLVSTVTQPEGKHDSGGSDRLGPAKPSAARLGPLLHVPYPPLLLQDGAGTNDISCTPRRRYGRHKHRVSCSTELVCRLIVKSLIHRQPKCQNQRVTLIFFMSDVKKGPVRV